MTRSAHRNANPRTRRRTGFTLIEAIVVIVILGILLAVVAPRIIGRVGEAKRAVAASGCAAIATAIRSFQLDTGSLPQSGDTVMILWEKPATAAEGSWKGPYVESLDALKDPWGNEFVLRIPGLVNVDFDVVSYGADGVEGGESDNADIINGKK